MSTGWSSEWLDFAYMDLSAAEHLLTMRPLPVEIICYHCEQAAEKFLKATLVQFDREPPKTHDLKEAFAAYPRAALRRSGIPRSS